MFLKRKRVVLTMKEKADIIRRVDNGETISSLANEYGIGCSTICDIRKKRDSILSFAEEDSAKLRKTMKKGDNASLEASLYSWFMQEKEAGSSVSNSSLCEMALVLNSVMGGDQEFKASGGWLKRFKARHGIKELEKPIQTLSKNELAARTLKDDLVGALTDGNIAIDDVYFVVGTNLDFNSLPCVWNNGFKLSILFCANADGSHKFPLLFYGNDIDPVSVSGKVTLPFLYRKVPCEAKSTSNIFLDWFNKDFVPRVSCKKRASDKKWKAMLVVPESLVPGKLEDFSSDTEHFQLFTLPADIPTSLKLLSKNFIQVFKIQYRKKFLENLLPTSLEAEKLLTFLKSMSFKDCGYAAAEVWESLDPSVIKKSWCKVFPQKKPTVKLEAADSALDLLKVLRKVPCTSSLSFMKQEDIMKWIKVDEVEDSDFVNSLDSQEVIVPCDNELAIWQFQQDQEKTNKEEVPTDEEACKAFSTALKWMEMQKECDGQQLLLVKQLKDLAERTKKG